MQIEIDNVRNIGIGKADQTIDVDLSAMPIASLVYLVDYGLKQSLNDAAANETEPDLVMAKVNKRLDALRNGSIRMTGGRIGDSVKARAVQIAMKHAPTDVKKTKDAKALRAWALGAIARNPAFMSLAQSQLDAEAALVVEFGPVDAAAE